jgi:polysaccharide export outer membrane protein
MPLRVWLGALAKLSFREKVHAHQNIARASGFDGAGRLRRGGGGKVVSTGPRFAAVAQGIEDYRLAPGDKVKIAVYNELTLSGEFAVSSEGKLSLPLVGDIAVVGMTAREVAAKDAALLGDGFLRNPRVSAEISTFRPFFILGEVKLPGQYPYAANMTVLNAIATAQGYTARASKSVAIRRAGSQEEQAYRLSPDLRVLPGDTIRIGERYF